MENLFSLILSFILGALCSILLISWALNRALKKKLQEIEQLNQELEKIQTVPIINLRVEKHQDMFYCFDNSTDEFVCQGANFDHLLAAFKSRFPNKNGVIMKKYAHLFSDDSAVRDQN